MEDAKRRGRAAARMGRAILHRTHLGDIEPDLTPLAGAEAISLLMALSRESWSLTGRELPTYARREIPCRAVPGRLT
jgi:hypothetical protein